ncbi:MAG: imidazoleglycerol-phosphate dehydratase [Candidatus Thorarchaeota archaeon]|nr:imidazoleglycerol-phosphate dehydratase [Candidatus Thorarchaeota archaeon]
MSRSAEVERQTRETRVAVSVDLDGIGTSEIQLSMGFLRHMLQSLATHSAIDMRVTATGDLDHHVSEDTALCLGEAVRKAVDTNLGIVRFGHAVVPMDCSLCEVALDLGGRAYSVIDLGLASPSVEGWSSDDVEHFFRSLSTSLKANLHVRCHYSRNDHHCVEAAFKALGLSLRQATALDPRRAGVPSSKGVL